MIAVMVFCFMSLAQAQSDNHSVTAKDIKKETQELINTLQRYSVEQRDQAVKEADKALEKLDGRIAKLERRIDNNWDQMTQAARQKAQTSLKTLRQQRIKLAEWYGSFKHSSADAWKEMKKGFTDAYKTMSDSWGKAIREFDKGNK
jgi:TolA-binding protein